jgi:hypothetical protein
MSKWCRGISAAKANRMMAKKLIVLCWRLASLRPRRVLSRRSRAPPDAWFWQVLLEPKSNGSVVQRAASLKKRRRRKP